MLEDGAILVPTDARADAIFDDQRLLERARIKTGKGGCSTAQRFEPSWQRIAGGKSAGLEIIGPAEGACPPFALPLLELERSEEHTSELQSLMRISYAVFCLIKKKKNNILTHASP